jgi:hypothetical protein
MNPYEQFRYQRNAAMGEEVRATFPTPSRPCTAHDMTFGGRCLNCGGVSKHAPQPLAVR